MARRDHGFPADSSFQNPLPNQLERQSGFAVLNVLGTFPLTVQI
jgi:hypothetical protein